MNIRRSPTGLLFICSAGHSGSTLLDVLLGGHSRIESLGEITQLPKNLALNTDCCCGTPIRQCSFWQAVLRKLDQQLAIDTETDPYALNLGFIQASVVVDKNQQTRWRVMQRKIAFAARYLQLFYGVPASLITDRLLRPGINNKRILYDAVAEQANADWVVDSSKHYLEAVDLYKNDPGNTRVVLLFRDGRAVYYSGRKRGFSRKVSLGAWKNTYQRALPLLGKHVSEDHLIKVRYEDLATDTTKVLQTICGKIGLEFEPRMLNFHKNTSHITNGNNMRFATSSEIKLDTAWQRQLRGDELEYFDNCARDLNEKLGYSYRG